MMKIYPTKKVYTGNSSFCIPPSYFLYLQGQFGLIGRGLALFENLILKRFSISVLVTHFKTSLTHPRVIAYSSLVKFFVSCRTAVAKGFLDNA